MKNDSLNGTRLWTGDFIRILLTNLLIFLGFEMMVTIIPLYLSGNGAGDTTIGFSALVFTGAALITRALAGSWLDRYGRRIVFLCGMVAMMLVTMSYSLVTAVFLILLIRVLHGLTWGVTSTSSDTVGSDTIPKERFGEGMGYLGLSNSLGMAVGPALGLFLLHHFHFQTAFLFSAGTLLLSGIVFLQMKNVKTRQDIENDLRAQKAVSGNPDSSAVRPDSEDREPPAFSTVSNGNNPPAAQTVSNTGNSLTGNRRSFLEKTALLPAAAIGLVSTSYGALVTFLALFGAQEGIGNIGIYFAFYAVAMLVTRPMAGRLTDRKGNLFVVLPGLCLIAAGLVVLSGAHSLAVFMLSAILYGTGMGAAQSALQAMAVRHAPADRIGAANATFLIGFDTGIGIGSLLSGLIATAVGYGFMYLSFVVFIIGSGALLMLRGRARH